MRVGFDISQIAHKGGVGVYTQNLAEQLSKIEDLEMIFFYSSLRKPYQGSLKNVKKYPLPPSFFEKLFNKWRIVSIEKFLGPLDIFHSSDWIQPPSNAKKVTTYHDVIPIKYPEWSHPKIASVHKRRLKLVEKEIDHVIAVSEATKKDLMEVSNIPEENITVIYEGPSAGFRPSPQSKISLFKKKYNLPDSFVLAIGGIGERKNLQRIKEATKDYHLVIAGQTIPILNLEELELLYSSAQALVYCSLYEGFGLPILDAQACGCPVITSNISSMPEIAGKGAILINPYSVDDIRKGIREVREVRDKLIERGFENLKKFSWDKCAEKTAEVYKRMMR